MQKGIKDETGLPNLYFSDDQLQIDEALIEKIQKKGEKLRYTTSYQSSPTETMLFATALKLIILDSVV